MKQILERFLKRQNNTSENKEKSLDKKKLILIGISTGTLVLIAGWWFFNNDESSTPETTLTPLNIKQKPPAISIQHIQSQQRPPAVSQRPSAVSQKPPAVPMQHIQPKPLKHPPIQPNQIPQPLIKPPTAIQPRTERQQANNNQQLTIPPQFVGTYLNKALEDIKKALREEVEEEIKASKPKNNQISQSLNLNLNDITPNLPQTITVSKVMEMPDGTISVYYNGKWLSKGMEIGNGWIIENIDDKYIYIKKTFKKFVQDNNKLKEIKVTKYAKIAYLISY